MQCLTVLGENKTSLAIFKYRDDRNEALALTSFDEVIHQRLEDRKFKKPKNGGLTFR